MSLVDLNEIALFYKESIFVFRNVGGQYYLVVMFDPSAKIQILSMALDIIMEDLYHTTAALDKKQGGLDTGDKENSIDQDKSDHTKTLLW